MSSREGLLRAPRWGRLALTLQVIEAKGVFSARFVHLVTGIIDPHNNRPGLRVTLRFGRD